MSPDAHRPVLLNEAIDYLNVRPNGRYVDGTLGLGGHSEAIAQRLGPEGRLLGLDVDPANLSVAKNRLQPFENRTNTRRSNFRGLHGILRDMQWNEVDGMLFDLGVSSTQLDIDTRGFSFQREGPLDMRLDPASSTTALSVLQSIDENRLAQEFITFGEGRFARKLARNILRQVGEGKVHSTTDLARICERVTGWRRGSHPATRVFLALRCLVNQELEAVRDMLATAPDALSIGGRLVIISFHSLEDRLVKERFRGLIADEANPKKFKILTKKPVVPTEQETNVNPRARSAKLRALERIA
jgi:16S rRNA (cytosine1402-N4)-methyltransferase